MQTNSYYSYRQDLYSVKGMSSLGQHFVYVSKPQTVGLFKQTYIGTYV